MPTKYLFNIEDYHKLIDAKILKEDDHVELINGEIISMTPIKSRHSGGVNRITNIFCWKLGNRVVVSVQNPVQLNNYSEPEPDITILKSRDDFYTNSHPVASAVLLLIEVSDTSLDYDRDTKLPLYANSLIPEVWIRNIKDDLLEVYR